MKTPPIVSPQQWDVAREELLAARRRRMPWMAVQKEYRFDGPGGPVSLLGLFEGRRQLIAYRAFAFIRDGERIYRTYFVDLRGDEAMGAPGATWISRPSAARRSGR